MQRLRKKMLVVPIGRGRTVSFPQTHRGETERSKGRGKKGTKPVENCTYRELGGGDKGNLKRIKGKKIASSLGAPMKGGKKVLGVVGTGESIWA